MNGHINGQVVAMMVAYSLESGDGWSVVQSNIQVEGDVLYVLQCARIGLSLLTINRRNPHCFSHFATSSISDFEPTESHI